MNFKVLLYISILYGFVLFIWNFIKPVYMVLHKKDFIKYWSICSVSYWIVSLSILYLSKIFKIQLADWFAFFPIAILYILISNIYFLVFRFFSSQEISKESLSKNEKVGIAIASLIHFFIASVFSAALLVLVFVLE